MSIRDPHDGQRADADGSRRHVEHSRITAIRAVFDRQPLLAAHQR